MQRRFLALALVAGFASACADDVDEGRDYDATVADAGARDAAMSLDARVPDAASADASTMQRVTVRFRATVGNEDLVCGRTYDGLGVTRARATPQDFRFYVQEVRLINVKGVEVPLTFEERPPHQATAVAMIDFTDGAGSCRSGAATTNMIITGTVPAGTYDGIVFVNGVPPSLNNASPSNAPAPLKAPGVHWGWTDGYRYTMAELLPVIDAPDGGQLDAGLHGRADGGFLDSGSSHDAGEGGHGDAGSEQEGHVGGGASFVHTGSTGCTGAPGSALGITCAGASFRANRAVVRLPRFNPATDTVVADLAAIFSRVDLERGVQCHGRGPACAPMFTALGIDPDTGEPSSSQSVFRVE